MSGNISIMTSYRSGFTIDPGGLIRSSVLTTGLALAMEMSRLTQGILAAAMA
jgi:hypothetical protein